MSWGVYAADDYARPGLSVSEGAPVAVDLCEGFGLECRLDLDNGRRFSVNHRISEAASEGILSLKSSVRNTLELIERFVLISKTGLLGQRAPGGVGP
jgi:hypothetical protein